MAAQLTSDGAAQPDSGTARSALALGELDITSTEVSLKGASRLALQVPGGSPSTGTASQPWAHPVAAAHAGVETQLEQYAEHEVLRAILDQGCDPREYGRQYETRLRQAELESIQDYLAESDNLVLLHEQARP